MKRYWASWWSGNYADEGCTKPPFRFWVSGERARPSVEHRAECSICAVIDAENVPEAETLIEKHFPDFEMRFCEQKEDTFVPGDRFQ